MKISVNEIENFYKKSKNLSCNKKNCFDLNWFFYILILLQESFI